MKYTTLPPYNNPKPLSHSGFYSLLALGRTERHAYAIKAVIHNVSLGSVQLDDGSLRRELQKLCDVGFIDKTKMAPAGKSGKERLHYGISQSGLIRLQEIQRMDHAVNIAKNAHILNEDVPTGIQKMLLAAATRPSR